MQRWTWLICGGMVLAPVSGAMADEPNPYPICTKTPTEAEKEAAKGAFKAGFGSYQEADYPKAIMYWADAYERDCTAHLLLLNLSNAYERMGDRKKAVHALKSYLERVPDPPDRAQLERRVENLEAQIATETPPPKSDELPDSEPEPGPSSIHIGTEDPPKGGKSIAPWIVVGAGGAITVVGALVYLGGASKVSDAEEICPVRKQCINDEALTKGNDGRRQMTMGGVVAGVGLAGVAGGLVWHFFLDNPSSDSASTQPTVQPTFSPGYAGLNFGGSF